MTFAQLQSPGTSASRQEWQSWLDDLREMPRSSAVNAAVSQAQKMLRKLGNRPSQSKGRQVDED